MCRASTAEEIRNERRAITFEPKEIWLSYYTCKNFDLVTLTFDLLLKKLNLRHNFESKEVRHSDHGHAWIFLVARPSVGNTKFFIVTLSAWPPTLTYIWKNLTLTPTFEPKEIRLSYYACVFLVARPFCVYQNYYPVNLTSNLDLLLKKKNLPLPKYKVSGTYMPQTCSKLAASLRLIVAASLLQTGFSYANFFSGALFWHTICAASMQRTVVAHCSGTQCAPQVCSTQLPRTVPAHNVRRK